MQALTIAVVPTFLLACILALTGCGSAPKAQAQSSQYCYTTQNIQTKNGERVESQTQVECSDKPGHWRKQAGVAKQCIVHQYKVDKGRGERHVSQIRCQHPDGSWHPEFN